MKRCSEYQEDLAVSAATAAPPRPATAAHLEQCADCQAALAEFRSVAAVHNHAAGNLPLPRRATRLEAWFLNGSQSPARSRKQQEDRSFWVYRARAVLSAAALIAALAAGVFVWRKPRAAPDVPAAAAAPVNERKAVYAGSTWQAYRQELRAGAEGIVDPANVLGGPVLNHYRVKDAHFEMN